MGSKNCLNFSSSCYMQSVNEKLSDDIFNVEVGVTLKKSLVLGKR